MALWFSFMPTILLKVIDLATNVTRLEIFVVHVLGKIFLPLSLRFVSLPLPPFFDSPPSTCLGLIFSFD